MLGYIQNTRDYGITTQSGIHEVEPPFNAIQPILDTIHPSGLACYRLFDCRHPALEVADVINEPVDLGINSAQVAQVAQNKAVCIIGHRTLFP